MKAFFALALYGGFLFSACNNTNEASFAFTQKVVVAEKALIRFENGKTVETGAQNAMELNTLKNAVGKTELAQIKCAPDGTVIFYKAGLALDSFEYSIKNDCSYIRFNFNDELHFRDFNNNARQLLQSMTKN